MPDIATLAENIRLLNLIMDALVCYIRNCPVTACKPRGEESRGRLRKTAQVAVKVQVLLTSPLRRAV